LRQKLILTIVITAAVTALLTAAGARVHYHSEEPEDGHVAVRTLDSRVLGERRQLVVHLPESYERAARRRYPVLYVLDGSSQSGHTAESARLMARIGVMPEIIVVGIPNTSDEMRQRDYTPPYMRLDAEKGDATGRADRFLEFLGRELIVDIDRSYRTSPIRMLAGNSRGGLFVVYSLMEAPDLFSARFAHSPALWRDDARIVSELGKWLGKHAGRPAFLYISLGDEENEKMRRAFDRTTALLRARSGSGFRWRSDFTAGANHQNNAVLATPVGLHEWSQNVSILPP
jgi:predicted alpha/beta superfamily hydrolase